MVFCPHNDGAKISVNFREPFLPVNCKVVTAALSITSASQPGGRRAKSKRVYAKQILKLTVLTSWPFFFARETGECSFLAGYNVNFNKTEMSLVKKKKENGYSIDNLQSLPQAVSSKIKTAKIWLQVIWNWVSGVVRG